MALMNSVVQSCLLVNVELTRSIYLSSADILNSALPVKTRKDDRGTYLQRDHRAPLSPLDDHGIPT